MTGLSGRGRRPAVDGYAVEDDAGPAPRPPGRRTGPARRGRPPRRVARASAPVASTARASATSSGVGVNTSCTTGICAGWTTDRPKNPMARPATHVVAQAVEVADGGAHALDRRAEPGGAGRGDDVAPGPVQPRVGRDHEVGGEVRLAEARSRRPRVRGGQLPGGQQAAGGLEQQVEVEAGPLGHRVDHRRVLAPRQAEPVERHAGERVDVRAPHRLGRRVDPHPDRRPVGGPVAQEATVARRASSLAAAGTASSRSTTTASAAEASALGTRSGRWPGT